jgi:shikimate dehydrogenase
VTGGRLAAVIGHPVAHSLSPAIHRAAFATTGSDWTYVAFDVAPGRAAAAIEAMRVLGIAGLSVTMPHKADVAAAVDRLDPAAAALSSVNTVSWDGGLLVGSSTDGDGFVASLAEAGVSVAGERVVVLGAGGAARSVVDALGRAAAGSIVVVNRTAARAEEAAALAPQAVVGTVADVPTATLVVNATSIGMGVDPRDRDGDGDGSATGDLPCDPDLLAAGQVVADLVYHPLETAWLAAARAVGAHPIDGLGMLVHQAALQQLAWTGVLPDTGVMRAAAEARLRAATPAGRDRGRR